VCFRGSLRVSFIKRATQSCDLMVKLSILHRDLGAVIKIGLQCSERCYWVVNKCLHQTTLFLLSLFMGHLVVGPFEVFFGHRVFD